MSFSLIVNKLSYSTELKYLPYSTDLGKWWLWIGILYKPINTYWCVCIAGLDYALLEKVRAEINTKEREDEQEMEKVVTQAPKEKKEEEPEEHIQVRFFLIYYKAIQVSLSYYLKTFIILYPTLTDTPTFNRYSHV